MGSHYQQKTNDEEADKGTAVVIYKMDRECYKFLYLTLLISDKYYTIQQVSV